MRMLLREISWVFGLDPIKPIIVGQVMAFDEAEFALGVGVRDVYSTAFGRAGELLDT